MTDAERIRKFLAKRAAKARYKIRIGSETPLGAWMDSFGMLELVSFLEDTFGIHLTKREIGPRRLGTLKRIVSLVKAKRATRKVA